MKRIISLFLSALMLVSVFTGCAEKEVTPVYTKHSTMIMSDEDLFNTIIMVTAFTKSDEEFTEMIEYITQRYTELNAMYDIYNDYEGVNNIKTINDNAGIAPVKVSKEIIDLLEFSIECYEKLGGKMNVAMGSVLKIWHNFREADEHIVPDTDTLTARAEHTDIHAIEIDRDAMTVYINDPEVSLDVGAVAKGYATEIVVDELSEKYESFLISAGGNVKSHGQPMDGERERWGVAVQNPAVDENYTMIGGSMDTAFIGGDMSVVCSGGYQRYVVVDGRRYHHLIDPTTLYPEEVYQGVAVFCEDSGLADALSTTIFLSTPEEAIDLINSIDGAECILVEIDGTTHQTDGTLNLLASRGIDNKTPLSFDYAEYLGQN